MNNTISDNKVETKELINKVTDKLADFVLNDTDISKDFTEYLKTIGTKDTVATTIPYIFERRLNSKSIIDLYLEKNKKIPKEEKDILKGFQKNISSVFEIKKLTKNGFELFNIINEKKYTIISPLKASAFRGLGIGYYTVIRFFNFEKENYMIEMIAVYPPSKKDVAYRYAISKIVQDPSVVYLDNNEMKKKIEKKAEFSYNRFNELFGSDEVTTSNKMVDDLIEYLNGSLENLDLKTKIKNVEIDEYFDVSSLTMSNMLTNAGFSSYSKTFDVTLIVDKKWGFYAIPFYKTFSDMLEGKEIKNSEKLVEYFLTAPAITQNILKRLSEKYSNFMEVINKIRKTNMTFEDLIAEFKPEQTYSSTTVLEESEVFSKVIEYISEQEEQDQLPAVPKVGRNDPCPCGSGKKYKKCCGANK